jgi:hypothetical protein
MKTSMLIKTTAYLDMLQLLDGVHGGNQTPHFPSGIAMDEPDGTSELWV